MQISRYYTAITCSLLLLIFSLIFVDSASAQTQEFSADRQPSVKDPVVIEFEPAQQEVAPGQKSALIITFKVPKYIWLGAEVGDARTPPATKVQFENSDIFRFGMAQYPEPDVEGVPNHLGITKVFKGQLKVVVPFTVAENASLGEHEITTLLTYTPGFSAGKLTTHTREPHTTTVTVVENAESLAQLPDPGRSEVPTSFQVEPAPGWDLPSIVSPMFFTHKDSTGLSKVLHTIFLDPPNHGKTIKQVTYPFISSTKQEGNNFGVGVALIDATKEGVMTGALSGFLFTNEHVGATGGFDLITCPAAYHNVQANVRFSGDDYQQFNVNYENLLFGAEERFGLQAEINLGSDPRFLFYGIGRQQNEEDVTTYDQVERKVIADFLYTPFNKLRFGAGFKFRNVEVGRGLNDIDSDGFGDINGDLPTLQNVVNNPFNDQIPDADIQNVVNSTILASRVTMIFDARNQEFNPTSGFYGQVTAEFNNITNDNVPDNIPDRGQGNLEDSYAQFDIDMRKYFSGAGQRFSMLFRNKWSFTTEKDIPFYELASIGGPASIRAFSLNRFRDQHSMFASMEMRYVLMKVKIMGFPMAVMMSAFLDAGQTFNENDGLDFSDDFNWAPGGSLRFVNYPNVGYIVNVATAQDGVNVTGGISLPF